MRFDWQADLPRGPPIGHGRRIRRPYERSVSRILVGGILSPSSFIAVPSERVMPSAQADGLMLGAMRHVTSLTIRRRHRESRARPRTRSKMSSFSRRSSVIIFGLAESAAPDVEEQAVFAGLEGAATVEARERRLWCFSGPPAPHPDRAKHGTRASSIRQDASSCGCEYSEEGCGTWRVKVSLLGRREWWMRCTGLED